MLLLGDWLLCRGFWLLRDVRLRCEYIWLLFISCCYFKTLVVMAEYRFFL
jgi:hypothetical protein